MAPGDALHLIRLIRDAPNMLLELSVVEQRYQAVLAGIRDGVPIEEVARRFGVSRQAIHRSPKRGWCLKGTLREILRN